MAKREFVVRVTMSEATGGDLVDRLMNQPPTSEVCSLVECLRYAGILSVYNFEPEEKLVFDIYPPKGVDTKNWSEMNARRMQSFGYKALSVPKT